MKFLVVDDNADARALLKAILAGNGHSVELAENGAQALEKAAVSLPDMIISDILMPVMDGFVLCEKVRSDAKFKQIPFVFYTATYTDAKDEEFALKIGADRFIVKPAEPEEFMKIIHDVVRNVRETSINNGRPGLKDKKEFLKLYNQRLVNKLEKKMLSLEKEIEKRKAASQKIEESEEKYRTLVESSTDHIFMLNMEGNYIGSNDNVDEFDFTSADELMGKNVKDLQSPGLAEFYMDKLKQVITTGQNVSFEHDIISPKGTVHHWDTLYPIFKENKIRAIGGICRDITNQKIAEKALKSSEEKYRTLVDHAGDAIFIAQNGGMKFPNPATVRLTGYSLEELNSMQFVDLIHPEDRQGIQDAYNKSLKGEAVSPKSDFRMITKTEKMLLAQMSSTRITWEGQPATLNFVRDVTDLRNAEEQLRQAQKVESIGRLAGGVAHDFNNMLNVITGYSEIALEQLKSTDPLYNEITEILNAAKRSVHLTRQLLAFARKQIISPKVLNMNTVVSGTLKMLQRLTGEDIDIDFQAADHLWNIHIDPSQVDQILANLMINARDAIAGVGKVRIETKNEVLDDDYCKIHPNVSPGEYAMLSVSDTGVGMDKETMENIFEPFFTTKAVGEGTGLGLSTIYGIVKQNNGHINVYSEPGMGSVFKIYIPRFAGGHQKKQGMPESPVVGGNETVLVVEDEPQVLKLSRQALGKYGYTILAAQTPEEALQIVREHTQKIHLLVTDVIMPGFNGKELAEKIKAVKPGVKILFMSGYSEDIISRRDILVEGIDFMQKPFSIKAFAGKVREILDGE